MICGPKEDGTYVVEFKTAAGEAMAISIPRTEAAVVRHFQERMPYGLLVPEVPFQGRAFSWGFWRVTTPARRRCAKSRLISR